MERPDPAPDANAIEKLDVAVAQAAGEVQHTPVVKALGAVSEIGDQPPLFVLSAAVAALGWWRGDRRMTRAGLRMFAAEAVATAAKASVKASVSRIRPRAMLEEGRYEMMKGGPNEGKWNSFPSGHTAGAVAVSRALAREYPGLAPAAYTVAAAVAVVQVPRCAHYPSDIAAGAVVGWVSEALVDAGFRAWDGSGAGQRAS